MVDAIRYVIDNGCVWRAVPADFPPWRTVYGLYQRWNTRGATCGAARRITRAQTRQAAGRNAEPTATVIDSQSVRAAPTVARASRGWDNAKKVNGRKRPHRGRHQRPAAGEPATPASTQDRDAARLLLFNLHRARRKVRLAWADGGHACRPLPGGHLAQALPSRSSKWPDYLHTFAVLPRRWVVERTLAWITSYRRCARDYECLPAHHEATVYWAIYDPHDPPPGPPRRSVPDTGT